MRRLVRFALFLMLTGVASGRQSLSPSLSFTQKVVLNIPAQPIVDALRELGRQTGLGIAVYSSLGRVANATRLQGEYTPAEALERILAPAGLRAEYLDDKTVAVVGGEPEQGTHNADTGAVYGPAS